LSNAKRVIEQGCQPVIPSRGDLKHYIDGWGTWSENPHHHFDLKSVCWRVDIFGSITECLIPLCEDKLNLSCLGLGISNTSGGAGCLALMRELDSDYVVFSLHRGSI
jgi:hypothetical protein